MMKIGQIQCVCVWGGMLTESKLPVVKNRPCRGWGGWWRLSESATGWEKEKSQKIHAVRGSHLRQRTNLVKIAVSGGVEIFYEIVIAVPFFISTCAEQIFTAKNSGSHKRVPGGLLEFCELWATAQGKNILECNVIEFKGKTVKEQRGFISKGAWCEDPVQ